ncbi:MAG: undecaprenyl-diphosphate phosphatase [Myxococcota bacterium]
MSLFAAVVLGIIQGLTEFLPISSSGHLVLTQNLLGVEEPALIFDVAVHIGTLAAVLIFYREDILTIIKALPTLKKPSLNDNEAHNLIFAILVVTIITGAIGFSGRDFFESLFSYPRFVSLMLILTGLILLLTRIADKHSGTKTVSLPKAFLVGLAQSAAIIPGISRSGATVSVALLLNVAREEAARLSFLAMIPAVLGAAILTAAKVESATNELLLASLVGMAVSAATGYLALGLLVKFVIKGRLYLFAPYLFIIGTLGLLLL